MVKAVLFNLSNIFENLDKGEYDQEKQRLKITLIPEAKNCYRKTIEHLISNIDFHKKNPSIFDTFTHQKTEEYKDYEKALKNISRSTALIQKIVDQHIENLGQYNGTDGETYLKNSLKYIILPLDLLTNIIQGIEQGENTMQIKKNAKSLQLLIENTKNLKEMEKCYNGISPDQTKTDPRKLYNYLHTDLTTLLKPSSLELIGQETILGLINTLAEQVSIKIANQKLSNYEISKESMYFLLWLERCAAINKQFSKDLIELKNIFDEINDYKQELQLLFKKPIIWSEKTDKKEPSKIRELPKTKTQKNKTTSNQEIENETKEESSTPTANAIQFEQNTQNHDPEVIALLGQVTKTLKRLRDSAKRFFNPHANYYNNQVHPTQAALYHSLPAEQIVEQCNLKEIILLCKNKKVPTTNTIIFKDEHPTIKFFVPAIIAREENKTTIIEKRVIEIFVSIDENLNKTTDYTIFHVWFKPLDLLQSEKTLHSKTLNKIAEKLNALSADEPEKIVAAIDPNTIIATGNKNPWASQILPLAKTFLLINTNKQSGEERHPWIFYKQS